MSCSLRVLWDDKLICYDFGPDHPMNPIRLELTMALVREYGLLNHSNVELVTAFDVADDGVLGLIHDSGYIAAVRRAAEHGTGEPAHGLGTSDNPVFPAMHDASALVAGASVAAARAVWSGAAEHAANIAGGLHHAMRGHAAGFCVYNDPAIAIAWLLANGARRVAYVDVDVHHGDGVQAAFYDDPRVLTVSLHESPRTLFPGTGFPDEAGAHGTAVNVALPAGTGDAGWLRAFHAVVPPLLRAFAPQILVTQHGCDTHALDPLAHLALTVDGQRAAYQALHRLAHDITAGRWVLTGGGGYELVRVVPRAWTHLLAEAAGRPVDPRTPTPDRWRDLVRARTHRVAPRRMTDLTTGDGPGSTLEEQQWAQQSMKQWAQQWTQQWTRPWTAGYDPANPIDQAVLATRRAVFPEHGLDPLTTDE